MQGQNPNQLPKLKQNQLLNTLQNPQKKESLHWKFKTALLLRAFGNRKRSSKHFNTWSTVLLCSLTCCDSNDDGSYAAGDILSPNQTFE